jgi:hypothetical protein
MKSHRLPAVVGLISAVLGGLLVSGCEKSIEKSRMEAAAAYSKSMCDCAQKPAAEAKSCAAGVKKPDDPIGEKGLFGGPKYTLDSLHAYIDMESLGDQCNSKIMQMQ